jgi:predicted TIM-barrel fold metal-dependent hydrolase
VPEWIDTHLHVWQPDRLAYPWLAGEPALNRAYLPADLGDVALGNGRHRVTAAVMVEAGRRPEHALDEVEFVEELAAQGPPIVAMVAHASLERGIDARAELAALARHRLVVGVRRNVQDEPAGFAATESFVTGVRLLAEHGYPFDVCVRHRQLPEVTELVSRLPEVTFVLDHLGKPAVVEHRMDPWREDMRRLAGLPNVVCKLSGLTTEADHAAWTPDDLLPYLRHVLAEFGAQRCMFGSDWPVATLATSYERWIDVVERALDGLSVAERDAVATGTARRVYGLPT